MGLLLMGLLLVGLLMVGPQLVGLLMVGLLLVGLLLVGLHLMGLLLVGLQLSFLGPYLQCVSPPRRNIDHRLHSFAWACCVTMATTQSAPSTGLELLENKMHK